MAPLTALPRSRAPFVGELAAPVSFEPRVEQEREEQDHETKRRRFLFEALAVGVVAAAVLLFFRVPSELLAPGAFKDDAVYLALGRGIAQGHGYHSVYMPGAPLQVKYPPGLPLIYAALWGVFNSLNTVFFAAGILSLIATSAAASIVWFLARSRLGLSAIIALPFAIGPFFFGSAIEYYTLPISESWYLLSWALVLFATLRACEHANPRANRDALLLGVLLAAAMLIRTQAVALCAGAVLALIVAGRRRAAFTAALTAIVPVASWQIWLTIMRAHGAALSTFSDEKAYSSFVSSGTRTHVLVALGASVWTNIREYFATFAPYLNGYVAVSVMLGIAVIALAAVGAWKMRRDVLVLPLTVAASVAVTLAWPWAQDRLLLPVFPFVGLMAAVTLDLVAAHLPRTGKMVASGCLALIAAGVVRQQLWFRAQAYQASVEGHMPSIFTPTWFLPHNSRLILIESFWINKHARPDDRLLAANPAALFLQTGRTGLPSSPAESRLAPSGFAVPGRFLSNAINGGNVSLVLVEGPDRLNRDVGVVQRACPNAFHLEGQGMGGWPSFLRVIDRGCIAHLFP
jgi:hypothetical protein